MSDTTQTPDPRATGTVTLEPAAGSTEPASADLAPVLDISFEVAGSRALVAIAVIAVAGDVAMRSGVDTYGGALGTSVAIVAILGSGRVQRRQSQLLFVGAGVFVACTAFRQSTWLLPFDAIAALLLVGVGASIAKTGSLFDLPLLSLGERSLHGLTHTMVAPEFAIAPMRGRKTGVILRGALIALPVVAVIVALLGSADRVFASLLGLEALDAGDIVVHIALLVVAAWSGAAVLRVASARAEVPKRRGVQFLGAVEATIVLGSVAAVLAVFGVAQLLDLAAANRKILERQGIAHADYARTGFFQLLWVAGIVVAIVLTLRAVTRVVTTAQARTITTLGVATCALTIPVVVVSVRRLSLYQDQYGLTMLRLYSTAAALTVGLIVLLVALAIAGLGRDHVWLPGAILLTGLGALFAMNIVNPEALVARTNLDRADPIVRPRDALADNQLLRGFGLDVDYLDRLSDDAVPTVVAHLDRLDPADRSQLLVRLCQRDFTTGNWLGTNRSEQRAAAAIASVCP